MTSNNIVLIGFMGCGKSTLAKELYRQTHKLILDSDSIIENNENQKISTIFVQKGEEYFRKLEREFCDFIASNVQNSIIATGGGMPLFCEVKKMGKVFFLHLDFKIILQRLNKEEIAKRPLFANKKSAFSLYNTRLEHYKKNAHFTLDASKNPKDLAQEILELL